MTTPSGPDAVQAWLMSRLHAYAVSPEVEFDIDTPFTEVGLDSVYALTLCGDIEDEYDIEIYPEVMWDYTSIRELGSYLSDLGADR